MKHLLSIEKLTWEELQQLLTDTVRIKKKRGQAEQQLLSDQVWAMLFAKASTRTRVSFEVGIRELGGEAIFLPAAEIQLGRGELIRDAARVRGRRVDGAILRTFGQQDIE